ncbi:phosphatidylglycerophosphatase A family protein [Planctomicrobium sp. SH664]|uniref:phosphatidylglycerophosphatase A family protein n=1 Tax=Planctomicrobium sp. SH664 TaxID=3448125 RepID=UPI003F5B7CF0
MTDTPPPTLLDRGLTLLATGLGSGYFPKAPGTIGSLLGPPLIWLLQADGQAPGYTALCGALAFVLGIPICNAGIRVLNVKDPKQVVYDEIVAFFWVFLLVPLNIGTAVGGFLLFRLFDILKPWPIRRFERLPKAWGVMADDALAGLAAGIILAVLNAFIGSMPG